MSNFKFSIFFILSFCSMQYSSATLAVHVTHNSAAPAKEFRKAINLFLEKRDAGLFEQIEDSNYLIKMSPEDSLYKVNNEDITDLLKGSCPEGYSFCQSNEIKKGEIFFNNEKVNNFQLKKYNSRAQKNLPAEKRIFFVKVWKITLIHTDGTEEFYLLLSPTKNIE